MVAFIYDLLIILAAGFVAGAVCKRFGISMPVGYLLAGAVIGHGALGLVGEDVEEIEHLAHAGALLLLFAIGIEFSLEEIGRLGRHFLIGGTIQMLLVAVPSVMVFVLFGLAWETALLIAAAMALSSTILVFRTLAEWGETASPQGRRAIGILLFQDFAMVPLMLLVPLLSGDHDPQAQAYVPLVLNSILFVATILLLRKVFALWLVPLLSKLRSVELVVLFALTVLVGLCLGAHAVGLPPALGAFAAGLILSGNRLTPQIDALILPYRESFGVVFFVSLGTLLDVTVLMEDPIWLMLGLVAVLALKFGAAAVALRATGLPWHAAMGMGLGLAQLGELSFVLLSAGLHEGLISEQNYDRMIFVAMGTLILTPQFLKWGIRWSHRTPLPTDEAETAGRRLSAIPQEAIVIGLGPIGRQAASHLEILGIDVCLVDSSPVNLHAFAQQGFRTVSGDASEPEVLSRAHVAHSRLAVVCVPNDQIAIQIVKTLRRLNPSCIIVVRCRYQSNTPVLKKAGAHTVVSEEAEASVALLRLLESMTPEPGEDAF